MRKLLIAYFITLVFGVFTYLSLSDSNYRLMSLDSSVNSLIVLFDKNIYPEWVKAIEFKDSQIEHEYNAICAGVCLGFLIWAVLFVLHRTQIFFVDLSAFLPLKK